MCGPFGGTGCNCGESVASAIYQSQRVALCCAAAAVAACLLVTLLVTGGVGVGVGYHYCVVESKSYELDLEAFRNKYTSSSTPKGPRAGDELNAVQSRSRFVVGDQSRTGQSYLEDQALPTPGARRSKDKDPQEQFAQKVERHKRKENPSKEYKRTTWIYKDNSGVRLHTPEQKLPDHYLRLLNRTQLKQHHRSENLNDKYNELQNVKSLLLSKLGANNVTYP